jgi:multimeric flavodoxin WrbA
MKLVAILGSPTGRDSTTLQYLEFLRRRLPALELELVDVGRAVGRLERDPARLDAVIESMATADGVIWAFPVYTMLTPAGLVRFVELLFERGAQRRLEGQLATVFTTSEHFFDHTAHNYMEAVSEDLGMGVFRGYSAAMDDLHGPRGQHDFGAWGRELMQAISAGMPLERHCSPAVWEPPEYRPVLGELEDKTGSLRVTVITDLGDGDDNLAAMIAAFRHSCPYPVDVLNLREIGMKGSCLGCLRCVYDGACVYKDGFAEAFDARILTADALVFACTLRHRYLSWHFKTYFDRNFRNGHRPVLHGKPVGWLLSGPLRQWPNLRQILEAKLEVQHSPRLGIVTDEYRDEAAISARIAAMAGTLERWHGEAWSRPKSFPGVGGHKIFRDLMYSLRGLVRADHRYYRREGLYDFPQGDWGRSLFNWVMAAMMALPPGRRWILDHMGELKNAQLRKVIEQQGPAPHRLEEAP